MDLLLLKGAADDGNFLSLSVSIRSAESYKRATYAEDVGTESGQARGVEDQSHTEAGTDGGSSEAAVAS